MTDRELLQRAAKAAGYVTNAARQAERDRDYPEQIGLWNTESTCWNPLVVDAHALRLAVKLNAKIVVDWEIAEGFPAARVVMWRPNWESSVEELVPHGEDPYAATRRCIVRAAAALGEAA